MDEGSSGYPPPEVPQSPEDPAVAAVPPPPPAYPPPVPAPPAAPAYPASTDSSGKKIAAGVCGILLGAFGVHKFILGYTREGLIMLLVSVLTCGIGAIPMGIIGLIEGIIYLTKSDQEFDATYVHNKRGWF